MFRLTFVVSTLVLSLAGSVLASPAALFSRNQCNTGSLHCCNNVQPSGSNAAGSTLGGILPIDLGASIPTGINCTPISVLGEGSGANCAAEPVCCENNYSGGAISFSCVPVLTQL